MSLPFQPEEHRLLKDCPVFSGDKKRVGLVEDVLVPVTDGQGEIYLQVGYGWLPPRRLYVPLSGIALISADRVILKVPRDEIESQVWDKVPFQYSLPSDPLQPSPPMDA